MSVQNETQEPDDVPPTRRALPALFYLIVCTVALLCVFCLRGYVAAAQPDKRLLLDGIATVYAPEDGSSGRHVGCQGIALRDYGTHDLAELLRRGVPVIATRYKTARSPRCGEWVLVENVRTGKTARARKLGVGPFGMCVSTANAPPERGSAFRRCRAGEVRVVAKGPQPYRERATYDGRWISTVDLTEPVCRALGGCSGWDRVRVWSLP